MKGSKLAGSKKGTATATKTINATIFTTTSTAFSVALSRVPRMSNPATTKTMNTAGRLTMPPACGPPESAAGSPAPMPSRKPLAYSAQPTATALTTREYSRIKLQPMIHASNSPITT